MIAPSLRFRTAAGVFFAAALCDACLTAWTLFAAIRDAAACAVLSMLVAACSVLGIGESLKDSRYALFYVVGFGVGSYVTVRLWGAQ